MQLALEPILLLIYPVPKPALIPLFMIWLGIGDFSKIAVIALACLLPVVIATFNGARSVDPMLLWSARARGTSERRLLWRVVLPAIAAADRRRRAHRDRDLRSSCWSAPSSSRRRSGSAI